MHLKDTKYLFIKGISCVLACNQSILACSMYVAII